MPTSPRLVTGTLRLGVLLTSAGGAWAQTASAPASAPPDNGAPSPSSAASETGPDFAFSGPRFSYTPDVAFGAPVAGQDTDFRWQSHDLRFTLPIAATDVEEWQVLGRFRGAEIDTDARLPDRFGPIRWNGTEFPNQLYDIELGASYSRRLEAGGRAGGSITIGSASDRPFASGEEVAVRVNAFWRIPAGENAAWWLFVDFSNTRTFAEWAPLPGFGYEFTTGGPDAPGGELQAMVGFPMSRVNWRPIEWLALRGLYRFPHTVDSEIAVTVSDWELFTGYFWESEAFLFSQRDDDDEQLFRYEQGVKAGLRSPAFWDDTSRLELESGYLFQRYWFEGEDFSDRHENGRLDVGDGPYVKLQLRVAL